MRTFLSNRCSKKILMFMCACLLLFASACSGAGQPVNGTTPQTASPSATQQNGVQVPGQIAATLTPSSPVTNNTKHPVLAFYYPWYTPASWCSCTMSDLPTIQYNS